MQVPSKLIYVGDPMCSWCYGISEELDKLVSHYEGRLQFEMVMGGLRAGGGDAWTPSFKDFLRHHWEEVGALSGQPFSYRLLEREAFNYDTEPACRAIVTAEKIDKEMGFAFFKATQKRFYLDNEDPGDVAFYEPICEEVGIDYQQFATSFHSDEMRVEVAKHFERSRELGVNSFPTLLLVHEGKTYVVGKGYATFDKLKSIIDSKLED